MTWIALGATLAGVVAAALGVRALRRPASGATLSAGALAGASSLPAPPVVDLAPLTPVTEAAVPVPLPTLIPATPPPGGHGTAAVHGRGAPGGSARPVQASPARQETAAPATAPASPPVAAAPPAAPPAAEAPSYDPSQATVDVGSVTPNNVNGDAVRTAIRGVALTSCYRNALRARGRRAFGSATLNLSIDESGKISGAILTGADWLPEMSRCVQGDAMGVQLRPGSVSAGGGTAEVWLSFRAP